MPRRIKRSAQQRHNRKSLRKSFRNLLRKRQAVPTIFNHELETLEPRVLLTTLVGGDIFEFKAPDPTDPDGEGVTIRVVITGDTIVELIGADVRLEPDEFGNLRQVVNLGDLPGTIYGEDSAAGSDNIEDGIDVLGGVGGADGVTPSPQGSPPRPPRSLFASRLAARCACACALNPTRCHGGSRLNRCMHQSQAMATSRTSSSI